MSSEKVLTSLFCSVKELKKKSIIIKYMEDWHDELAAIYLNNKVHVVSSICPHFGGEFKLEKRKSTLKCKWHDWEFDIESGKLQNYKLKTCLKKYPFEIKENGMIEVKYVQNI